MAGSMTAVLWINKQNYKNFTYKVCKEYIFMSQFGIYFTKHSHLVGAFNEKIRALKPTGITNIWMTKYLDYKYLNIKEAAVGPQMLDFTELSGGFQVWAGGLIFAGTIFLIEQFARIKCIRRYTRTLFQRFQ